MEIIETIPNHPNFIINSEVGSGGFGSVYKVLNTNDNNIYAIKRIKISKNNIKDIENEINILKNFDSEYIVKYYDSFQVGNNFYIVMEYCDNSDLYNFIKEHKENNKLIDEKKIFEIINNICQGLKEIHNQNIIHRDLRPKNIFMSKNNKIKIGDFGISKELINQKYATSKKGDVEYMALEMLEENAKYNNKVDIWSLGCIIYELFNLKTYYKDISFKEMRDLKPYPIKIDKKYNQAWLQLLNKILIKKDYNARLNIDEICNFLNDINIKLYREIINKMKLLLKDSEFEITKLKNDAKNKTIEFLNKKSEILNDLLKTKNRIDILIDIEQEIKISSCNLEDKLVNYYKNISTKSKVLIAQSKNFFNEIPFEPIDVKFINLRDFLFKDNIGFTLFEETIYSSIGSFQNIRKHNGFFLGIFKYGSSWMFDDNYLWNIIDMIKRNYSDNVNKICDLLYYMIKDDINLVIKKMNINEKKMLTTTYNKEKH